ncbi:zinc knuckle [Ostertagia ostertagi]
MPHEDSAKIRRQVGFFKKQVQRQCSTANVLVKEYDINIKRPIFDHLDDEELESFRQEVTAIRSNLLKAYSSITKLHDDWTLIQDTDPDEVQIFNDYISKYGDYRNTIAEAVEQLEDMDSLLNEIDRECNHRKISISSASPPESPAAEHNRRYQTTATTAPTARMQNDNSLLNFVDASILAKLELPTFDGNLLEYPEFACRFATLVGNKTQLDDTTKLSLLKSCLRGRALQSIQGLSMTPENYRIAMDILRTHYDDKVTVKHILYTKLAQLPDCDPEGRNLQTLYNRMFALIRQFTNGYNDNDEKALGAILINKLPARIRSMIYDRTSNSHNLSPSELLNLLTDIVRKDAVLFEMEYHAKNPSSLAHHGFHVSVKTKPPARVPRKPRSSKQKPCPYCNTPSHQASRCTVFPTVQQRHRQVKALRLCYNCLSNQHSTKDCPSKYSCKFCSRRHHSSLCFSHFQNSQQRRSTNRSPSHPRTSCQHFANTVETTATMETPTDSCPKNEDATIVACTTECTKNYNQQPLSHAALMCAPVRVFNPSDPSRRITATAFLDSGSSQSYITDDLAKLLNLSTLTTEDISISTFGSTTPLQVTSRDHLLGIVMETGEKRLKVKSLPTLTGRVKHVRPIQGTKHNVVITTCKPSILIGNDYFWDMLLSDDFYYETLPNGHRMIHTNLGNIFVGKVFNLRNAETYSALQEDTASNSNHYDELSRLVSNFWKLEFRTIACIFP